MGLHHGGSIKEAGRPDETLACWDNLSTQLKKIYNKGLVVFNRVNVEMPHLISLRYKLQETTGDT